MMKNDVLLKARRATVKSFASLRAMALLCLVMLSVAGVKAATAYAIWCQDNSTFYFTYSSEEYAVNGKYDNQTITAVWKNVDRRTSNDEPAWVSDETISGQIQDGCRRVVIDESFQSVKPVSMKVWFSNMKSLTQIDGLEYLNTCEAASMMGMFANCEKLTSLDLSHFNTSAVTSMYGMFQGCKALTSLNLNGFDVSQVTQFDNMFLECSSLTTIYCNDNWFYVSSSEASSVNMFLGCNKLVGANSTAYDSNHTDKEYARIDKEGRHGYFTSSPFPYVIWCEGNKTLYFTYDSGEYCAGGLYNHQTITKVWSGDDVLINTKSDLYWSMDNRTGAQLDFERVIIAPSFSSVRPKSTRQWFQSEELISIEGLEYLNTSEVTNMYGMFANSGKLTSLDLSHFDTGKVTNMGCMFSACENLEGIYVNNDWNTEQVASDNNLFSACKKLVGGNGTAYDDNHTGKEYARIDREDAPGYFSKKSYAIWCEGNTRLYFTASGDYAAGGTYDGKTITKVWSGNAVANSGAEPQWITEAGDDLKEKCTFVLFDESFSSIRPRSTARWFANMEKLYRISGIEYLNTSNVTNMASMFMGCKKLITKLNSLDLSNFDTSNVTDMSQMFMGCSSLTILDLSSFNTANVTNMGEMFSSCSALTYVDLSGFATENVTSSYEMFRDCTNLTTIFCYNDWNLPDNHDNAMLFYNCGKLVGGNGTAFTTDDRVFARVDREDAPGYFTKSPNVIWCEESSTLYLTLPESSSYAAGETYNGETITKVWKGTKVVENRGDSNEDLWSYEYDSGKLTNFKKVVIDPSFSSVRPKSTETWFRSKELTSIEGLEYLNTSEVTDMNAMFAECEKLTSLDLSHFDTSKATKMASMFSGCRNLETIYADNDWNTEQVAGNSGMFSDCEKLVGGNGTAYDSNHKDKDYARIDREGTPGYFTKKPYAIWCESNSTLYFTNPETGSYAVGDTYDEQPITNVWRVDTKQGNGEDPQWFSNSIDGWTTKCTEVVFDESFKTVKPKSLRRWFAGFAKLTTIEGLEYLNTSEATDMSEMFKICVSLTSLDLHTFNTEKVTDMGSMFESSYQLTSIDVSSFNTTNVANMKSMFNGLDQIENLDLSNFNTEEVTDFTSMFYFCKKLESLDLSKFKVGKEAETRYMFANCGELKTIYCDNDWETNEEPLDDEMFISCPSLVGGNGTKYSRDHCSIDYARVDRSGTPGYFTSHDAFDYTISDAMVGTLYLDHAVYVPSNEDYFHAYYVKSVSESGTMHLKEVKDVIPAQTAVIIFGNEGSYLMVNYSGEVTAIEDNMLQGVTEETSVADLQTQHGTDIYVLSRGTDSYVNFRKAGETVTSIPANRAYLPYTLASGARELAISFDEGNEASGIETIAAGNVPTTGVYTLSGQRVTHPQHGLYIVNGKKVLVP